jgi:hypothetical protein
VNRSTAKSKQGQRHSQAKRTQTKPTPQTNPTPETKPTPQHRTTHKKQAATSDTPRHPLWGPTQVKVTHVAEPRCGPRLAVHISGRMMRPLEPASKIIILLEHRVTSTGQEPIILLEQDFV